MEIYCFRPKGLSLHRARFLSRTSINETSEPEQVPELYFMFWPISYRQGHVNKQGRSSYKPRSLTDSASSRKKKDRGEPYQTDTIGLVGKGRRT